MEVHYRLFTGQEFCAAPLPFVPADFDERLKHLRRRLGFSQHTLARRVGTIRQGGREPAISTPCAANPTDHLS